MPHDLPPNFPPIAQLMAHFGMAAQHYQSLLERRLAPKDLTPLQLSVLSHLARLRAPQPITQVATAMNAGQPAISKIATKFQAAGWITLTPNQNDKRIKQMQITQTGAAHLLDTQKEMMPDIAAAFSEWNDDQLAHFSNDLRRFADLLSKQG